MSIKCCILRDACLLGADFIYSQYLMSGHSAYRGMVWQIAEDYACADLLLRLPGYAPMPAFREVEDVPLVVRHAQKTKEQVSCVAPPFLQSGITAVPE